MLLQGMEVHSAINVGVLPNMGSQVDDRCGKVEVIFSRGKGCHSSEKMYYFRPYNQEEYIYIAPEDYDKRGVTHAEIIVA
ncbi:MAG: hypothetical protein LBF65_01705 [Holosporales bacterium]|jgi:hypothetical protein|nr:hypothetical protein [Holosporales bacterium]